MASKAKELKEEGNRKFQKKDYLGAMDQYELALKLTPPDHPDRAVFHSNRAACFLQMKPAQHDVAIHECNLALQIQPGFTRALLRRARAYEALGNLNVALEDVKTLLQIDAHHQDAIDMLKRIQFSIDCPGDEAHWGQDKPPLPTSLSRSKSYSGSHITSNGVENPPVSKSFSLRNGGNHGSASTNFPPSTQPQRTTGTSSLTPTQSFREIQTPRQTPASWPMNTPPSTPSIDMSSYLNDSGVHRYTSSMDPSKVDSSEKIIHQDYPQGSKTDSSYSAPRSRPVKLIYDHDIRLAEIPVNSKLNELRKLIKSKFPSSKSILIKYKDPEGDLVTITSTEELRQAEASASIESVRRNLRINSLSAENGAPLDRRPNSAVGLPSVLDQLRLHIVEVPAEQEPYENEESPNEQDPSTPARNGVQKSGASYRMEKKEKALDKWMSQFSELFRMHLGIDPNGYIDFQELGLELCAQALEETITTEEAYKLLQQAGCKFQEMIAMGFLNWGNVYMCAARREVSHDDESDNDVDFSEKLQAAFDWAHVQYALAEEKFLLSLKVKPDFCDSILALGQKDFESAKLHWALAVASQKDLSSWDSTKTLELFCIAAEHTRRAAEVLEKQEDVHHNDIERQERASVPDNPMNSEQDISLKKQVYLFWGNVLYEQSQVEFRLGLNTWKQHLDEAVGKFELAGVHSSDITMALQKHLSVSTTYDDEEEETPEQDPAPSEEEINADKEEMGISSTNDNHEDFVTSESHSEERIPLEGVTDTANSLSPVCPVEEHMTADDPTDIGKSMQAVLPCENPIAQDLVTYSTCSAQEGLFLQEHLLRDNASGFPKVLQVDPSMKAAESEEGAMKRMHADSSSEEHVPLSTTSDSEDHVSRNNVTESLPTAS
ncbi:hypothetical protein KP509_04G048100 [Ceratopteris richardii]|nr:hypothetical protein KP509_04G048100 [Ceratopteris richardii]